MPAAHSWKRCMCPEGCLSICLGHLSWAGMGRPMVVHWFLKDPIFGLLKLGCEYEMKEKGKTPFSEA